MLYNEPIPQRFYRWELDLERQVGILELPESRLKRVVAPLHPFLGSIGVAPPHGRHEMTLTPGEFGGNMDCVDTHEGVTLYLPVWVKGAYLAYGDVHALQGDGELNGTAARPPPRSRCRSTCSRGAMPPGRAWRATPTSWWPPAPAR